MLYVFQGGFHATVPSVHLLVCLFVSLSLSGINEKMKYKCQATHMNTKRLTKMSMVNVHNPLWHM